MDQIPSPSSMPHCCPMCHGELFVSMNEPRRGTTCPFCRQPLTYLYQTIDDKTILTLLAEGKRAVVFPGTGKMAFGPWQKTARVVLNLSRVVSVSNTFFDALALMHEKLQMAGGSLKLCGLAPNLQQDIDRFQSTCSFEIYPDEQSALAAFLTIGEISGQDLSLLSESSIFSPMGDIPVPV